MPKNTDFEGETVGSVQELTLEHPQIALRKDFLKVCCILFFLSLVFCPLRSVSGTVGGIELLGWIELGLIENRITSSA